MRVPSGLKPAEFTLLSCPRSTPISVAVVASQIRAVLSGEVVMMRDPSGLKAAKTTPYMCPRSCAIS